MPVWLAQAVRREHLPLKAVLVLSLREPVLLLVGSLERKGDVAPLGVRRRAVAVAVVA
jgi:hypothetical protein